jgi:hypothetical protein
MTREHKVQRWAQRELEGYLSEIIVPGEGSDLVAFQRFTVQPVAREYRVWERSNLCGTFADRRTAVSWCVAMHHRRFDLARTIQQLDRRHAMLDQDFLVRKQLAQKSRSTEFRDQVYSKLQTRNARRAQITEQLKKCISLTKYLQLKGFSK